MSAYVMEQAAKSGTHLSNQTNQFFFEEDNGRITVASPKLSIDYQGTARTVDLKDWFAHNASARNGVVELVWKNVFFQPLVPEFGLSSDEALEERSDLKKLLSGQLQSSGSLQKLVSPMLLADALKRTDAAVSAGWYLRAQDNVLSAYHQRTRLFAFVPSPARDLRTIRASRNNELTAWIRGAQLVENHAQLAQPSSSATAGSASNAIQSPFLQESAPKLPELDPSQLLYALSLSQPYSNLSQYATRISDAKLEWNDQVHHAYWLAHGRMATSADLANATAIFRQNNQDANKSLVEILVGITGSY